MRLIAVAAFAVSACLWSGAAFAEMPALHSRTVSWRISESCNVEVASGTSVLEWNDCSGDWDLVTVDYAGYDHPLAVLFYTGTPDFSAMDEHAYTTFMCSKCAKWAPDNYCTTCDPCDWRCYKYNVDWCCDLIKARSYLPACLRLEIIDVY